MAADALVGKGSGVRRAESPLGRLATADEVAASLKRQCGVVFPPDGDTHFKGHF